MSYFRKKLEITDYMNSCYKIKLSCVIVKDNVRNDMLIESDLIEEIQLVRNEMKNSYSTLPRMSKRLKLFLDDCDNVLYRITLYNDYKSNPDKSELIKVTSNLHSHATTLYKEAKKEVLLNEYISNISTD